MTLPRLRQVALAARELDPVTQRLESVLGLAEPFRDPGIVHFGLQNAVYAAGDTFLEVVSPVRADTAAGRYLDRRGGDCGYMAMFQLDDIAAARKRLADLGVRTVWDTERPDIVDIHLHPKDVPGAIVALDWAEPEGSWRWGGPEWEAQVPWYAPGGLRGLTVAAVDPRGTAQRWAAVTGVELHDGLTLALDAGRQRVDFVPAEGPEQEGIVGVRLAVPGRAGATEVCGVTFELVED